MGSISSALIMVTIILHAAKLIIEAIIGECMLHAIYDISIQVLAAFSNALTAFFLQLWNRRREREHSQGIVSELKGIRIVATKPIEIEQRIKFIESNQSPMVPAPPPLPAPETRPNIIIAQLQRLRNQT